jgi:pyrroline-5-carboxylate reductase
MTGDISTYNIGIIGGGHLGTALAKALLRKGVNRASLKISYSGNPATFQSLQNEGLADAISTNASIAAGCSVVFITIRPADILSLKDLVFNSKSMMVSCIAGTETAPLEKILSRRVIRIMPSSPVTIEEEKAVCAIYTGHTLLHKLLAATGFTLYPLASEYLFHIFTASVCLPAAFLQLQVNGMPLSSAAVIDYFTPQFALFKKLCHWAYALTPFHLPVPEKQQYIQRMATRGGITEAIISSLNNGDDLTAAIIAGIERSRQMCRHQHAHSIFKPSAKASAPSVA